MSKVIELEDDMISLAQAHSFFGEYHFINQKYDVAKKHLDWIIDYAEDLESDYDDLLNDEITKADILAEIIEKYSLE